MAISEKSKNASASTKKRSARIDRPFDPAIVRRAKKIAAQYQVVMRLDEQENTYYGRGLELPGAFGDGPTPAACLNATRESMAAVVAFMLEQNEKPPVPASDQTRLVQLNVRISAEEKLMFEEAARQKGQGLSEFIRGAALATVGGTMSTAARQGRA